MESIACFDLPPGCAACWQAASGQVASRVEFERTIGVGTRKDDDDMGGVSLDAGVREHKNRFMKRNVVRRVSMAFFSHLTSHACFCHKTHTLTDDNQTTSPPAQTPAPSSTSATYHSDPHAPHTHDQRHCTS